MPVNILNLPVFAITKVVEGEHDYHIYAETRGTLTVCPHCCQSEEVVGYGRKEVLLKDLSMHGKRVGIYVNARRLSCKACTKTFMEAIPAVTSSRQMTDRLVAWIGRQSLSRTFASIADEIGVVEGTIRSIFREYVADLERTVRFETPRWMGIDEIHIIKKPRCVICNIENYTVVNMLEDRNKPTVINYLYKLPGREKIRYVTMDMWLPYKDAVRGVLPQATIVVDKFHVVRMANDCLEAVRKSIRASLTDKQRRGLMHDRFILLKREADLVGLDRITLESWTKNYPALGAAYQAKEGFFAIYDALTVVEGEALFKEWEAGLAPEIKDAFYPLTRAVNNWMPEIMAYFDHQVTNAYTESLNNLIRVANRMGRGYSFEALRAKILFTEGVHKKHRLRPKFQRLPEQAFEYMNVFSMEKLVPPSTSEHGREINYGADISTLVRLIEEGKL